MPFEQFPGVKEEIPDNLLRIRNSFIAYDDLLEERLRLLGYQSHESFDAIARNELRTLLLNFVSRIEAEKLPEYILLEKMELEHDSYPEDSPLHTRPTQVPQKYFLPRTYEKYTVSYSPEPEKNTELFPENKDFTGFQNLRDQYDDDPTPPVRFYDLKNVAAELGGGGFSNNLTEAEIEAIVAELKGQFESDESFITLERGVREVGAKREKEKEEFRQRFIQNIKTRTLSLFRAVEENARVKFNDPIYVQDVWDKVKDEPTTDQLYFLPHEQEIVIVPTKEKKRLLSSKTERVPDFSSTRPAPPELWQRTAKLGKKLISSLPARAQYFIESGEFPKEK